MLADQVDADPNDVMMWRDEALMLNLASFGPAEHELLIQAGIEGLGEILALSLDGFRERIRRARRRAQPGSADRPHDRRLVGPGRTLEDE